MVLVIDIGNSNVVIGVYEKDNLFFTSRISTNKNKTVDEYVNILYNILVINNIKAENIKGVILSSVVPPLSSTMSLAVKKITGLEAMVVGPGIKTGLDIKIDNPAQLGSDLVADAVGAIKKYNAPLIIIDMGTATTVSVVTKNGTYIGGAIIPGVKISLDALCNGTAQLPYINLDQAPENPISSNSIDCMKSGIIYGFASMLDGMVEKFENQLNEKCTVIATGGMSNMIVPFCKRKINIEPNLLIDGLYEIYKKNVKS